MTSRNSQRLLWGVLVIALILVCGLAIARWAKEHTRKLDDYGALPNFSLVNQNAAPVSLASFKGHIWVADLIFTHCASICPTLTEKMFRLQAELDDVPEVRLASISVDPVHDTPDTLRVYAKAHGADTSRWSFLTGSTNAVYNLVKTGFHLPLDSVGGEQQVPIIHSPRFALVDVKGHVRGYYDGTEAASQRKILADVEALQNEQAQ